MLTSYNPMWPFPRTSNSRGRSAGVPTRFYSTSSGRLKTTSERLANKRKLERLYPYTRQECVVHFQHVKLPAERSHAKVRCLGMTSSQFHKSPSQHFWLKAHPLSLLQFFTTWSQWWQWLKWERQSQQTSNPFLSSFQILNQHLASRTRAHTHLHAHTYKMWLLQAKVTNKPYTHIPQGHNEYTALAGYSECRVGSVGRKSKVSLLLPLCSFLFAAILFSTHFVVTATESVDDKTNLVLFQLLIWHWVLLPSSHRQFP